MRRPDLRILLICSVLLSLVWIGVLMKLWDSDYLDSGHYSEALYAARLRVSAEHGTTVSFRKESALAYWACYPDVAQDAYFGRTGPLGHLGAREHFDRHGRMEGRVWPLDEKDCTADTDVGRE